MTNQLQWCSVIALLLACGSTAHAADDVHDSVVIVFDASGSMDGSMGGMFGGGVQKMVAAKRALKTVLTALPQTTHIGLLVFSDVRPNGWVHPLGPRDDAKILAALDEDDDKPDAIKPIGGTPLGEYLKIGADRLLGERTKSLNYGTYRLVAITDGEATDGNLMASVAPEIVQRGIELHAIGVAMPQGHLLSKYANSYQSADSPRALEEAARKAVRVEASTVAGQLDGVEYADLVAAMDPEVMTAIIDAFSAYPNHPIGERPPEPKVEEPATDGSGGSPSSAPVVNLNGAPAQPGAVGCNCSGMGGDTGAATVALVVLGFVLVIIARRQRS
ncbi:VWA domain-containing protein [Candidatus Uhrbacteria bacterium]|nr:VWA domain-containing protein [Candidatus Uhrbacteria bacterium]